ncbi:MAG TPA: hypothetical protein VNE62_05600 [Actinomycetota bacterium]|nr:hypothetical protein [Actinomycetota bacterium]
MQKRRFEPAFGQLMLAGRGGAVLVEGALVVLVVVVVVVVPVTEIFVSLPPGGRPGAEVGPGVVPGAGVAVSWGVSSGGKVGVSVDTGTAVRRPDVSSESSSATLTATVAMMAPTTIPVTTSRSER